MNVRARTVTVLLASALGASLLSPGSASAGTPIYIRTAVWQQMDAGLRLTIQPTDFGRLHADEAPGVAWDQALNRAGRRTLTDSKYDGLYDQFRCHTVRAPDKPYWDLEAWRPNVTYQQTLAAFCNPTRT